MLDNLVGTSVGNKLCHEGLLIQRFHGLRLAQSRVTVANGGWSMYAVCCIMLSGTVKI